MAIWRFRFRLRTLFILIGIVAIGLALQSWYRRIQLLPQEHHYLSLEAGYTAVRMQVPEARNWAPGWTMWERPLDRKMFEQAMPYWEKSLRHARLADHYMQVSKRPWMVLWPAPASDPLPPLPQDDQLLWKWWDTHLSAHVQRTGLNCSWGNYWDSAVNDRNLAFLRIDSSSFNRFLQLYDIWPGAEYFRAQPAGAEPAGAEPLGAAAAQAQEPAPEPAASGELLP
jgi:hypothetical protein